MRRLGVALFPVVLILGCGHTSPESKGPSTELATSGWVRHDVAQANISFELPPNWHIANEVNGKIEVKEDKEALAQAKALFDEIKMVSSAAEEVSEKGKTPTTFTIMFLKPKKAPSSLEDLLKSALSDLQADYPNGDPKGTIFESSQGKAVLTTYSDSATRGQSKGGPPDIVEVENIQFRIPRKNAIYLLNVTGAKERTAELQTLAEALLQRVTLG